MLWNSLLKKEKNQVETVASHYPELPTISSGENFGLVSSKHTKTFGGLLAAMKDVEDEEDLFDLAGQDDLDAERVLRQLGVDPALRFQVMPQQSLSTNNDSEMIQQTNPLTEEQRTVLEQANTDSNGTSDEPHAATAVIVSLRIISPIYI